MKLDNIYFKKSSYVRDNKLLKILINKSPHLVSISDILTETLIAKGRMKQ